MWASAAVFACPSQLVIRLQTDSCSFPFGIRSVPLNSLQQEALTLEQGLSGSLLGKRDTDSADVNQNQLIMQEWPE